MTVLSPALLCDVAAHAVFAAVGGALVIFDLRAHRLPNKLLAWGTCGTLALLVLCSVLTGETEASRSWIPLLGAVGAGVLYGGVLLVSWYAAPAAVGAGDVKLAPLIGLMSGWSGLWIAGLWVPLFIGVFGIAAGLASRARGRADFAFGPVMIGACWLGIILSGVGWIG